MLIHQIWQLMKTWDIFFFYRLQKLFGWLHLKKKLAPLGGFHTIRKLSASCIPWTHTCVSKKESDGERGHVQFKEARWKVRETDQSRRMISRHELILAPFCAPGNPASIFCSIKRVIQAACHPQFPSPSISSSCSPSLILSVCANETKSFISSANCVYAQGYASAMVSGASLSNTLKLSVLGSNAIPL